MKPEELILVLIFLYGIVTCSGIQCEKCTKDACNEMPTLQTCENAKDVCFRKFSPDGHLFPEHGCHLRAPGDVMNETTCTEEGPDRFLCQYFCDSDGCNVPRDGDLTCYDCPNCRKVQKGTSPDKICPKLEHGMGDHYEYVCHTSESLKSEGTVYSRGCFFRKKSDSHLKLKCDTSLTSKTEGFASRCFCPDSHCNKQDTTKEPLPTPTEDPDNKKRNKTRIRCSGGFIQISYRLLFACVIFVTKVYDVFH